ASRTRLYLNEQLNEYIEVATADLMTTIDLAGENSPLVLILIRPEKLIQHSAVVSETIQADFLAGEIAQQNLQDNRLLWASGSGPEEFIRRPTHACGSLWHCGQTDP